jgi:hypothetical protein
VRVCTQRFIPFTLTKEVKREGLKNPSRAPDKGEVGGSSPPSPPWIASIAVVSGIARPEYAGWTGFGQLFHLVSSFVLLPHRNYF